VKNITPFLSNTNKPTTAHCATQSDSSSWLVSKWPETLMAQHTELDFEIGSVNSLLYPLLLNVQVSAYESYYAP